MTTVYKSLRSYLGLPHDNTKSSEAKGIGSILDTSEKECVLKKSGSLRRTLSADQMVSHKLSNSNRHNASTHAFPSCDHHPHSQHSSAFDDIDHKDADGDDTVHSSADDRRKESAVYCNQNSNFDQNPKDIWSLIGPQNSSDLLSSNKWEIGCKREAYQFPKPRNLQMCTEGLGCESCEGTALDFSYSPPITDFRSEEASNDGAVQKEEEIKCQSGKKCGLMRAQRLPRSFPPPLSSLSTCEARRVFMRSYKKDGRFVLKAVEMPRQISLQAYREGGRLKMHLVNPSAQTLEDAERQKPSESESAVEALNVMSEETTESGNNEQAENENIREIAGTHDWSKHLLEKRCGWDNISCVLKVIRPNRCVASRLLPKDAVLMPRSTRDSLLRAHMGTTLRCL
eukprot:Gb_17771 [translate_table: standard]